MDTFPSFFLVFGSPSGGSLPFQFLSFQSIYGSYTVLERIISLPRLRTTYSYDRLLLTAVFRLSRHVFAVLLSLANANVTEEFDAKRPRMEMFAEHECREGKFQGSDRDRQVGTGSSIVKLRRICTTVSSEMTIHSSIAPYIPLSSLGPTFLTMTNQNPLSRPHGDVGLFHASKHHLGSHKSVLPAGFFVRPIYILINSRTLALPARTLPGMGP
uniref:Secreted protein n=1 Tax=Steinernema glaseri TaxID=37863 RepID=A0A1I8AL36_9BILA